LTTSRKDREDATLANREDPGGRSFRPPVGRKGQKNLEKRSREKIATPAGPPHTNANLGCPGHQSEGNAKNISHKHRESKKKKKK